MNAEYMMVDPNELVIDLPVDDAHVQELYASYWWSLTDEEIARLNPPPDTDERDEWLLVGHIPRPRTRLGWFCYHLVHGLWMRYPLRKVLGYALANTRPETDLCV